MMDTERERAAQEVEELRARLGLPLAAPGFSQGGQMRLQESGGTLAAVVVAGSDENSVAYDIPLAQYLEWPAISRGFLWAIRKKSPAHAFATKSGSKAQDFGGMAHLAILEPDIFSQRYAIKDFDARTKDGRARQEEIGALGQELVSLDESISLSSMRKNVFCHPSASAALDGPREVSLTWRDQPSGVVCKARLDAVAFNGRAVADLKTTSDASPASFQKDVYNFGYFLQGAHYIAGARACGLDVSTFLLVACEKNDPWAVAVYAMEGHVLEAGERERQRLLSIVARCQAENIWPSYPAEIRAIGMPDWAMRELGQEV